MAIQYPLITVVTVTYNLINANRRESFLRCVDSVKKQTYNNIEHIIIDGASTDGTLDLIKDTGLKCYSEPDTGIWNAMNKGVNRATGHYVTFLNSDDYYFHNNGISESIKSLLKEDADYCYSDARITNNDKEVATFTGSEKYVVFGRFYCHQTQIVKLDVIKRMCGFTENLLAADNDFMLRLIADDAKGIFVDIKYVSFDNSGVSSTISGQEIFLEHVKSFYEQFGKKYELTLHECELLASSNFLKDKLLQSKLLKNIANEQWLCAITEEINTTNNDSVCRSSSNDRENFYIEYLKYYILGIPVWKTIKTDKYKKDYLFWVIRIYKKSCKHKNKNTMFYEVKYKFLSKILIGKKRKKYKDKYKMIKAFLKDSLKKQQTKLIRESVQADIASVRESVQADIASAREAVQADIASVREAVQADIASVSENIFTQLTEKNTQYAHLSFFVERTEEIKKYLYNNLLDEDKKIFLEWFFLRWLGVNITSPQLSIELEGYCDKAVEMYNSRKTIDEPVEIEFKSTKLFYLTDHPVNFVCAEEQKLDFAYDIVHTFILNEYYKEGYLPKDGQVIFDCGSYYGDTMLAFKVQYQNSPIYTIEASKKKCFYVQKNIELNSISRIFVYNNALSNVTGASVTILDEVCTTITIDDIVEKEKIKNIGLIKFDIEGAETSALQGAINTIKEHKPILYIPIYHLQSDLVTIPEFLSNLGLEMQFSIGWVERRYRGMDCVLYVKFL